MGRDGGKARFLDEADGAAPYGVAPVEDKDVLAVDGDARCVVVHGARLAGMREVPSLTGGMGAEPAIEYVV